MTSRKDTLQQLVALVSDDFAPAQLVRSLCTCAQDATLVLREKTDSFDPKRDAEQLRFQLQANGSFKEHRADAMPRAERDVTRGGRASRQHRALHAHSGQSQRDRHS